MDNEKNKYDEYQGNGCAGCLAGLTIISCVIMVIGIGLILSLLIEVTWELALAVELIGSILPLQMLLVPIFMRYRKDK